MDMEEEPWLTGAGVGKGVCRPCVLVGANVGRGVGDEVA